jgi:trimethylamine--corrinoid protein Co-methyltransferase
MGNVLLTPADCQRIHGAALTVLNEVGVRVDDEVTVRLLEEAGATLASDKRVRIPAHLVEWALRQAPREVRIADRQGHLWQLGPQGGTLVLTGNALYITRGRERSELRAADLEQLARVADACPNLHGMVGTSVADYPPTSRDFAGFRIMAEFTGKHLRPCIYTPAGARTVMEMAQVLLEGASLRERPIVSTGFSILSPLHWTALALSVFKETAGRGVPVMINSEPLAGATAPVTLAGCLVIGDADTLSGLLLNQLLEPGRPCFYNVGFAHVFEMSVGLALTGAPENALLQAAGAEMARFHGLPCAAWMSTESLCADAQAAFEKMMTGLAHAAAGVNFIWGAGNLESTLAMSCESLVTDDEIAGYFLRYRRGFTVDEEGLALDDIREAGRSGDFLHSPHTLKHFRQVLSRTQLAVRARRGDWEAKGSRSFEEAAAERVREILAQEPKHYLDSRQRAELERLERMAMEGGGARP